MLYNFLWANVKIIFGIISHMYFFCISGLATLLIGVAKKLFYSNYTKENEQTKLQKSKAMGTLIIIASALFICYMAKLFVIPEYKQYNIIISITIAFFSFCELGIAIFNLIKANRNNDILLYSLRSLNTVSGCFAIVLTQVALLNVSINASFYNAITGCVFGVISIIIGINVLIKTQKEIIKNRS